MQKKNVALIGYGYWGKILRPYLHANDLWSLRHIFFTTDPGQKGKLFTDSLGHRYVNDLEQIWADTETPCVIIATPIATHFDICQQALLHGKHVLCEKPLTLAYAEAQALSQLAQEKGLNLTTEYTYTFSPSIHKILQLVADGVIGDLISVNLNFQQLGRFNGYSVYDLLGSHTLSLLSLFTPLEKLEFELRSQVSYGAVVSTGVLSFKSHHQPLTGQIYLSLDNPVRSKELVLLGRLGTIRYAPMEQNTVTVALYHRQQDIACEMEHYQFDEQNNIAHALTHWHQLITSNQHEKVNSVQVSRVLEQIKKWERKDLL